LASRFRVGYQIHPQQCTIDQIREAYRGVDSLGADTVWVWDHMHPLYGRPDGNHFEAVSILAAMAVETRNVHMGTLVASVAYRNPEQYAYTMGTIDHLSGGRAILGIGAGWFERDYREYGYDFGDAASRLRDLARALPRIKERVNKLMPPPIGRLPIMIGGGGERVTLKLTAQYADMWNTFPPVGNWRRKNAILTEWCQQLGRDPKAVERTCSVNAGQYDELDQLLEAGVEHFIIRGVQPFPMQPVEELLKLSGR
jgi:probable F420-dependent oxidoreductase